MIYKIGEEAKPAHEPFLTHRGFNQIEVNIRLNTVSFFHNILYNIKNGTFLRSKV